MNIARDMPAACSTSASSTANRSPLTLVSSRPTSSVSAPKNPINATGRVITTVGCGS